MPFLNNNINLNLLLGNTTAPERAEGAVLGKFDLNNIYCGDNVELLKGLPSNSVDIVVTSPPYDGIRDYKGNANFDLHKVGAEIFRTLKDGGIAVMVIQDQTRNFGKTLTSFRTAVDWCDNIGFKLFESLIYKKLGAEGAWWNKRFRVDHEYMLVFLKGDKPAYFNKEPLKIPSKWGGVTMTGGGTRLTNGTRIETRKIKINLRKCPGTVWAYETAGDGTRAKHRHPATYPDKLPYDFIRCFCPPDGIVLDPFIGSGTTALAAKTLNRNYLGFDISQEYVDLANERIECDFANYAAKAKKWDEDQIRQINGGKPDGHDLIAKQMRASVSLVQQELFSIAQTE
jgi:site-specific DNA-methyltransferase (adenine-specific)